MSFISDLFKKKPGGTMVGNLIRGVVNTVSNGAFGTGAGIITQRDYDKKTLNDVEFYSKYGTTKNDVNIYQGNTPTQVQQTYIPPTANNPLYAAQNGLIGTWLQRNLNYILFGVLAVVGLVVYAFKGKRKFR